MFKNIGLKSKEYVQKRFFKCPAPKRNPVIPMVLAHARKADNPKVASSNLAPATN
tara:strand:- start:200 stop:364 length:165 start_codon:yes stop_codon:yes gene_type:complete